jgi:hypothetical protein
VYFTIIVYVYVLRVRAYTVMVVSESIDVPSEDGLYLPKHVRVLRCETVKALTVTLDEIVLSS